jgi:tyrosyl-tRNA synthetase
MFSEIELKDSKPNQLRDKYAFLHRYELAKRYIKVYHSLTDTQFKYMCTCYSFSSFAKKEMMKLSKNVDKDEAFEELIKMKLIQEVRKTSHNKKIYALTRKGRGVIEDFYEMLLGQKDFEV